MLIKNKNLNKEIIYESLISLKRAGSNAIITYFALDIAKKINTILRKIIFKYHSRSW